MHLRIYNLVTSQSQSPPEEHTLSEEKPARLTPSTWRIWSPNLRPPSAAGDPLVTRQTNTPAQKTCNLKRLHQNNKRWTFVDCFHPETNFAISVFAKDNLSHPMVYLRKKNDLSKSKVSSSIIGLCLLKMVLIQTCALARPVLRPEIGATMPDPGTVAMLLLCFIKLLLMTNVIFANLTGEKTQKWFGHLNNCR